MRLLDVEQHPDIQAEGRGTTLLVDLSGSLSNSVTKLSQALETIDGEVRRTSVASVQNQQRLTPSDISLLVGGYLAGVNVSDLAELFGVHRDTVRGHLNRSDVGRRARGLDDDGVRQAAALYEAGNSLAAVGKVFGLGAETIRQAFMRAGIRLRPRPGWQD
jgi:hypothetical protein